MSESPDYAEIKQLEHETHPDTDYRLDHLNEDGSTPNCCVQWVKKFTENLPDPLYEPNAQTGKMPWE
jgi:hypothetical protein